MSQKRNNNRVALREIFVTLQSQMIAAFQANRKVIRHPVTKGDVGELQWLKLFEGYLPQRYRAAKAFVIDSRGNLSDQIDVVIYDQQYSPFLFNQDGAKYVPAESVYAVFEVRPELDYANIRYAGRKAASVRELYRSSAPIPHAGGVYKPKKPPEILGGILCLEQAWKSDVRHRVEAALSKLARAERIDLGCVLTGNSFATAYKADTVQLEQSSTDTALIFFFLKLLGKLQASGTVAALDFDEYSRTL